ncbi:MBG domain-containing protein, partial [Cyclobacterium salsum]|uniref:MBG domain-containing protein n=1 Tax=Cyclobacterium salsum TaxID=2666329 RepID=UPI00293BC070
MRKSIPFLNLQNLLLGEVKLLRITVGIILLLIFGAPALMAQGNTSYEFPTGSKITLNGAAAELSNRSSFSLEFWANFSTTSGIVNLVDFTGGTDAGGLIVMDGKLTVDISCDFGCLTNSDPISITTGEWYHIAIVFHNGAWDFYVDGAAKGTNIADQGGVTSVPNYTGFGVTDMVFGFQNHSAVNDFAGKIDDIRLWSSSRTQTEIQNNRSKEIAGNEAGLIGYWKLNESSGTTVSDSQTNATALNGTSSSILYGRDGAFQSVAQPTVTTSAASSITATGATLSGNVTDDGGDPVTERGFVYATSASPTTSDTKVQVGSGTGSFSEAITGLSAETTYYISAYAINGEGTSYGNDESFTTSAPALAPLQSLYWPNENIDKIEGISLTGSSRQDIVAIASAGSIIAIDIDQVNEKAYWFDQTDSKIYRSNLDGTSIEAFVSNPGYATTIFVDHVNEYLYWPNYEGSKIERIKLDGTGREDVISATDPIGISVDVSGSKVYWYDQTNASIYRGNLDGSGSEEFISNPGYATTVYIDQKNSHLYWPNNESSKIERIKLDGTGREDVISATDPIGISVDVSGSKVYWYDQTNGSIYRGNLDGSGSEEFISDPGYATTLSIPWELPANTLPTVATSLVSSITATGATLGGNVTDDGGATVTERGFVYSLTADDPTPTLAESSGSDVTKVIVSGTTGVFNETISGLSASSQYSFAAYAINSVGTSYGSVEQFSTVNNPISEYSSGTNTLPDTRFFGVQFTTPNTDPAYSMTGFTFLDNTGSTPTGAGKVYVFTSSPSGLLTPSDLPTYTEDLLGISDTWNGSVYGFSGGLNLDANTTYWVLTDTDGFEVGNDFSNPNNAIYATGSGNNYVNQLQRINYQVTGIAVSASPTVTTTAISTFDATTATLGGNVTDNGGVTVTDRGIVYNTTGTPTTSDTKVQIGDGDGIFSDEITGLTASTTYYVRAYAINGVGTSYGSEESFTTLAANNPPTNISLPIGSISRNSNLYTKLTTTDADSEDTFTYTLVAGDGDDNNEIYKIVTSGADSYLRFNVSNELVPEGVNSIRVQTSDGTDTFEKIFTFNVAYDFVNFSWNSSNNFANATGVTYTFNYEIVTPNPDRILYAINNNGWELPFLGSSANGYYITEVEKENVNVKVNGVDRAFEVRNWSTGLMEVSLTDPSISSGAQVQVIIDNVTNKNIGSHSWTWIRTSHPSGHAIDEAFQPASITLVAPLYPPSVTTDSPGSITANAATLGGNVTNDGGTAVTERGIVWDTTSNPLTSDNKVPIGSGEGAFSQTVGSLPPNTTLYVRSFATNSEGTAYGSEISFETLKHEQSLTFPEIASKTYGDDSFTLGDEETDKGLIVTYTSADPTIISITNNQAVVLKAGTTTITATQEGNDTNLALTPVEREIVIDKAALTITADDKSKVYGEENPALTFSYTGLVNGDTEVSEEPGISMIATAGSNVGTYPINLTGGSDANYDISLVAGELEITQAALTITADDKSKVYGEANPSLTFTYTGLVNGDTEVSEEPAISTTATAGSNVGTYPVTLTGGSDDNYAITLVAGELEVTQAALTINADDKSKVYGEANPTLTFTYTGLVNGDTEVSEEPGISTTATASSNVGTYPVTLTGGSDANYAISLVAGELEITQAALTITADDKSKVYGEANPGLTFTYTGLVNGDTEVSEEPAISTTATAGSNVGTYPIALTGGLDANYDINLVAGELEVTQVALTITADDKSKVYGEANPSLTFTYTGLVNGDTEVSTEPAISTTATASSNVGTYPIALTGGSDENYDISLVAGELEITQAALTIKADDKSKVYGEANPSLTFTYTGLVNGDT